MLIFTVGSVSAANQTDEIGIDDAGIISQSGNKTFPDLNDDISSAGSQIDIVSDYQFNQSGDWNYKKGVVINHKTLVINGNNHVIDAKSNARIFTVNSSQLTINNLVLWVKTLFGLSPLKTTV